MLLMDEYAEIIHLADCLFDKRKVKKSKNWWKFMQLKNCPNCDAKVEL